MERMDGRVTVALITRAAVLATGLVAASVATVHAACSPDALDAVRTELRSGAVPTCGTKTVRRAFKHARRKAAKLLVRAAAPCAGGDVPAIAPALRALTRGVSQIARLANENTISPACAVEYENALEQLTTALGDAANGTDTSTSTSTSLAPGESTTTTLAPCTVVHLDVDRSDCSSVASDPLGLVNCSGSCGEATFTVPAFGSLRLTGTPGTGDTSVDFGTDCDDDGTVPLSLATPPDCTLSCDCSSDF
jgi:hypothetical protein